MNPARLLPLLLGLVMAPLLLGVINRTKAAFAGRVGQPLLQPYFDLVKLLGKGAVYSRTTTWLFGAGPIVSLASVVVALALVPLGAVPALLAFPGDLVLFAYLLGLARFLTVTAALDTGSSFEGMGASREVCFATLAEPALLLGLAAVARETGALSLSAMYAEVGAAGWTRAALPLALVISALAVVLLAETSRIPFDDPNTHLELTMIHEVMVLDHSGPDLAFIEYGAALKLWLLGSLLVGLVVPVQTGSFLLDGGVVLVGLLMLAVLVGIVESSMARLRLLRVPQLLVGAIVLAVLAIVVQGPGIVP
jgi:formate hydrogenlyase subunit 4